ncbi:MAG: O-antigen polymerase [Pseudomonadota bacterium]|nr:MAG: hypothetical protein DIU78_04160 [Pseudomonadota bacterium]
MVTAPSVSHGVATQAAAAHHQLADQVVLRSSPRFRLIALGGVVTYFVLTGLTNLLYGHSGSFLPYAALLLLTAVMFGPLLLLRDLGPLHILVAPALFWFANLVLRQSELVVFGLERHDALPGLTPNELNSLCAKFYGLSALAQCVFLLGFFTIRRARVPVLRLAPPKHVTVKALIVLAAASLGLAAYHNAAGGLEGMLLIRGVSRATRQEIRGGGDHLLVVLGLPIVLAYVLHTFRNRTHGRALLWVSFVFGLVALFLASGSRSALLYPFVILGLIHFLRTGRAPKLSLLAFIFAAWLLVGIVGVFRTMHFGASSIDWDAFSGHTVSDFLDASSDDLSSRGTERNGNLPPLYYVPHDSPLLLGSTYLRILLSPIPQVLLPFDKPTAAGRLNGQLFFSVDAGIPVSSVTEAYWNFHVPGVLVIFFGFGVLAAYVFRFYLLNHTVPGVLALYSIYVLYFEFSSERLILFLQQSFGIFLLVVLFCGFPKITGWRTVRLNYSRESRPRGRPVLTASPPAS